MISLHVFQLEVWEWSRKNFGDQLAHRPLLGIVEECSEIIDATERGSRCDVADAVGDTMVYIADYCARRGFELTEIVHSFDAIASSREGIDDAFEGYVQSLLLHVGRLCHAHLKQEQGIRLTEDHVGNAKLELRAIIGIVWSIATLQNIDFEAAVASTWEHVSKRNWKANPTTGV